MRCRLIFGWNLSINLYKNSFNPHILLFKINPEENKLRLKQRTCIGVVFPPKWFRSKRKTSNTPKIGVKKILGIYPLYVYVDRNRKELRIYLRCPFRKTLGWTCKFS